VANKPADCDYLTVPVRRKNCEYRKQILVEAYSRDVASGRPVVSML
jgi:hypothetical protein